MQPQSLHYFSAVLVGLKYLLPVSVIGLFPPGILHQHSSGSGNRNPNIISQAKNPNASVTPQKPENGTNTWMQICYCND